MTSGVAPKEFICMVHCLYWKCVWKGPWKWTEVCQWHSFLYRRCEIMFLFMTSFDFPNE
jgi:hypothetical protein